MVAMLVSVTLFSILYYEIFALLKYIIIIRKRENGFAGEVQWD